MWRCPRPPSRERRAAPTARERRRAAGLPRGTAVLGASSARRRGVATADSRWKSRARGGSVEPRASPREPAEHGARETKQRERAHHEARKHHRKQHRERSAASRPAASIRAEHAPPAHHHLAGLLGVPAQHAVPDQGTASSAVRAPGQLETEQHVGERRLGSDEARRAEGRCQGPAALSAPSTPVKAHQKERQIVAVAPAPPVTSVRAKSCDGYD
jgi:hypothetical protein